MTPIYITLGKTGDIIGSLPILYHRYIADKRKPVALVASQYLPIFDRVPFVEPLEFKGDWQDLSGAVLFVKQLGRDAVCLSTYGKDYPIEQRHSSFQLDAYDRAGMLEKWDTLPFGCVMRGEKVKFQKPTILYADLAESAPFLHKEELFKLLTSRFPKHQVLRLSMYKLAHIFDFVGWYTAADAVVTVDTAHLHLTAASKTPVVALAADKPSRWKGSAWSRRFCFYCRYGEFPARQEELVDCLAASIAGGEGIEAVGCGNDRGEMPDPVSGGGSQKGQSK